MSELKQKLVQFKQVTIDLIKVLMQDKIYKLDGLLNSRQMLIEDMEKLTYTIKEITDICNELEILKVQEKLSELMQEKREIIKGELDRIQATKNANNNYNKSFYANSGIFNKQI